MMREAIGIIAVVLAFVSCVPYLRDIRTGRTKPHAFSWLVWGALTAIGFAASVVGGGGPGAWQLGFTAAICGIVFVLALTKGERDIRRADWMCMAAAAVAGALWLATNDPLLSVILVTVIDALGFIPTFRKSYMKPHQETLSTYVIGIAKHGVSIVALMNITMVTVLYPFSLFILNIGFVSLLLTRRRKLGLSPRGEVEGTMTREPAI